MVNSLRSFVRGVASVGTRPGLLFSNPPTPPPTAAPNAGDDWSLFTLMTNSENLLRTFGAFLVGLVGVVLLIVAIVNGARKLASKQSQVQWVSGVIAPFIGGALCLGGGWIWFTNIAAGAHATLINMGGAN